MERRISSFTINSSNSLYSGGNYPEGWGKSGRFHSSADQANSFDFDFYRLDIFQMRLIYSVIYVSLLLNIYSNIYLASFSAEIK